MKKRTLNGRATTMSVGLAWGLAASLCSTGILSAVLAKLIDWEYVSWEMIGYGAMIILTASAFSGAWAAESCIKRRAVNVCLLSGGLYFIAVELASALFFGGQFEGVAVTAILIGIGSGFPIILAAGKGRKKHRRRYPNR